MAGLHRDLVEEQNISFYLGLRLGHQVKVAANSVDQGRHETVGKGMGSLYWLSIHCLSLAKILSSS